MFHRCCAVWTTAPRRIIGTRRTTLDGDVEACINLGLDRTLRHATLVTGLPARVAELADAQVLGTCGRKPFRVQVPALAPHIRRTNNTRGGPLGGLVVGWRAVDGRAVDWLVVRRLGSHRTGGLARFLAPTQVAGRIGPSYSTFPPW